jgi:hypothetical protein
MYKEATRKQLRFTTTKGSLSIEQLWSLSIDELDKLAVKLESEYENSKEKSFVIKRTSKNKDIKLAFDIVLDVLNTKVEEAEEAKAAAERKANNEKIFEIIESKEQKNLENLSIAELKKRLQ